LKDEFPIVKNYEIITIEEAKARGLTVPENPGTEVQIFAYRPPAE